MRCFLASGLRSNQTINEFQMKVECRYITMYNILNHYFYTTGKNQSSKEVGEETNLFYAKITGQISGKIQKEKSNNHF